MNDELLRDIRIEHERFERDENDDPITECFHCDVTKSCPHSGMIAEDERVYWCEDCDLKTYFRRMNDAMRRA